MTSSLSNSTLSPTFSTRSHELSPATPAISTETSSSSEGRSRTLDEVALQTKILFSTTPSPIDFSGRRESHLGDISPYSPARSLCKNFSFKSLAIDHVRKYPPVSLVDTIRLVSTKDRIQVEPLHGPCNIFSDEEIVSLHEVVMTTHQEDGLNIDYSTDLKAIIQQQSLRGCAMASAAMLLKDFGVSPSFDTLSNANLGDDELIKAEFRKYGFDAIKTEFKDINQLRQSIEKYGSCELTISDPLVGWHSIVVDSVTEDLLFTTLRDPYHGWQITINSEALIARAPTTMIHLALTT